jgi:uncharacterized protein (DUF305 family)
VDRRGLAPHVHTHQDGDSRRGGDLDRLSRVRGPRLDLAFLEVMTARHRAGRDLAGAEGREGGVHEVRQLAWELLAEHQRQIATMQAWRRAWSNEAESG